MQTITCYYYPNSVDVQLNTDPTLTLRNRVMYQRSVKVYKGVDNIIRFRFKNSEQKPVNVAGWDIAMNVLDEELGEVLFTTPATVVGSSVDGVVVVTLKEQDLMDMGKEYYNYSLSVTDPTTGQQQVVYADDNYDVRGELIVKAGHYPTVRNSIEVSIPTNAVSPIITSAVLSGSNSQDQRLSHTAQFYFNNFTGSIGIESTLDELQPNGTTSANVSVSWANIDSVAYANQTTTDYHNWEGISSGIRFVITPVTGTVERVVYRG